MKTIDLCDADALQPFVLCLEQRGVDTNHYLERQRIPPDLVRFGAGKIIKRQAWRFFEDVQRREGLEDLGFLGGGVFCLGSLGRLGGAVQQAETLLDSVQTSGRLVPMLAQGNIVWMEHSGDLCTLFCRTDGLDFSTPVPDHYTVLILTALIRIVAGEDWRPDGVLFQTNPADMIRRVQATGDIPSRFNHRVAEESPRCDSEHSHHGHDSELLVASPGVNLLQRTPQLVSSGLLSISSREGLMNSRIVDLFRGSILSP